ncbi:hypothetical protein GA0070607_5317 [Micromonospora coriariae]|uniref:DUF5666 domain-containing protein n=1 Tax=Micromonospora coriariae TaxID=285665 RepID=A0A1C4XIW6_9ACTN|nr:hypothetical protein [Micromonospora coriariae]SCF08374.1 hypothetical protein GA0070607_5317 [Micromonospora coriariae]
MLAAGSRRRRAMTALITVTLLLLAACDRGAADPTSPVPPTGGSGGEQRHGAAPAPDRHVTYQPDVVFVGGGGGSVRGLSDDALTWRVDPDASGADRLARGRIMFLTGRAVGRVLDVRRDGDDLAVTLGPVDITQVIRDGTFATDGPVSLEKPVRYDAGTPFWAGYDGEAEGGSGGGSMTPLVGVPSAPNSAVRPAVAAGARGTAGFPITPICCANGVGAHFSYDGGGIRITGTVTLLMKRPSARFHLEIRGGTVRRAELRIDGMAGLRIEIAGATNVGQNVNKRIPIPLDFSVPVGQILGVPFSVTANQLIGVQTAFSAKDGNIKAAGEWSLGGSLGFGYADGAFGATTPWKLTVRNSITDSIYGPSVGVSGIVVHYQASFRAGLGAFGFTAGLYATVTASVGLTVGSALGAPIALCRSTQLGVFLEYGVGYRIPAGLVKAVNAFLELINAGSIEAKAGIGRVDNVFNKLDIQPNVKICRT